VNVNSSEVSRKELATYIRQQPNKRIFGARFHLGLYNWSNIEKDGWPHGWLRNIGEEPVIFDVYATTRSKEQMKSFLSSKGYFNSEVLETVETAKKRSKVWFNIKITEPYVVRKVIYEVEDPGLLQLIYFDSINSNITRHKPFSQDDLLSERSRLERFIRDKGFYNFSSDFIRFRVDTTVGDRKVDVYYVVASAQEPDPVSGRKAVPHSQYQIRNVYIYPEYSPGDALSSGERYFSSLDTVLYKGFYFIAPPGKPRIKYDLLLQSLYIMPGNTFNISSTERSHKHISSLKTYRLVNISFNEPRPFAPSDGQRYIDGIVQLTPFAQQSYSFGLEGTNSGGNLGAALNLMYQHKNLFHGAQQFNLKLKGSYETLSNDIPGFRSTQELGVEANIQFPEFLIPFLKAENIIRKYDPKSYLQLAYNFQKIPVYTRTVANATFGYNWNSRDYSSHMLYPLQMNLVKLPYIDPEFALRIDTSSYLSYSYKDVLIMGGSYTYIFNNQKIQKSKDHTFFKFNFEAAGNLPAAISRLTGAEATEGSYSLFGQQFAQYIRSDIDVRYNRIVNDVSSVVYRGFIGVGVPYGNSVTLPFEKQYFGGGANGIRGWQVRTLGPGSYINYLPSFINQTADIKLEFNAEYRFKLFWILEGAVFIDAGNIWTIKEDTDRPGAMFRFDKFVDDMAVGSGFGMRFDLNFVLLRADIGIKMRDPSIQDNPKWIRARRPFDLGEDFSLVIGIGYPF